MTRLALVLSFAFALLGVSGCSQSSPGLDFAMGQEEAKLTYPGAALVDSSTNAGTRLLAEAPFVERQFRADAAVDDVIAWYRQELGHRRWIGGERNDEDPASGYMSFYLWHKPGLYLDLQVRPPAGSRTDFTVRMGVQESEWEFAAQIQALRDSPEATLAPPGASPRGREAWYSYPEKNPGRGDEPGTWIRVVRTYKRHGPADDVERFFSNALAGRGWKRVASAKTDPLGAPPIATWASGDIRAMLFVSFEGGDDVWQFTLNETIGPDGSPLAPSATT